MVEQTFKPGASVARVARDHDVNANQVWAWRRLYKQGLLVGASQADVMLPVLVDDTVTRKRKNFEDLADDEWKRIEEAVREEFSDLLQATDVRDQ